MKPLGKYGPPRSEAGLSVCAQLQAPGLSATSADTGVLNFSIDFHFFVVISYWERFHK